MNICENPKQFSCDTCRSADCKTERELRDLKKGCIEVCVFSLDGNKCHVPCEFGEKVETLVTKKI